MARFKCFLPARLIYRSDSGWHSRVGSASSEKQPEREKYYDEMADVATGKKSKDILDSMSKKKGGLGYATIEDIAKEKLERKVESNKNSLFLTLKEFFKKVNPVKSAGDPEKAAEKEAFLSLKFLADKGFNVDLLYPGDLIIIENGNLYIKTGTKLRVNGLPLRPDYRAEKKEIKTETKKANEKIIEEVTVELTAKQKEVLEKVNQFLNKYEKSPKELLEVGGDKYELFKDKQVALSALVDFLGIDRTESAKLLAALNKIRFDAIASKKPVDKNTTEVHEKLIKLESYSFLTKAEFLNEKESDVTKNLNLAFEENYQGLVDFSKQDPSRESLDSGELTIFETALSNFKKGRDEVEEIYLTNRANHSKLVNDLQKKIVDKQEEILRGIRTKLTEKLPSTKFEQIRKGKDPLEVYVKYPIADLRYISAVFEKNPWVYAYLAESKNHSSPITLNFVKLLLGEYQMARGFSQMLKTALEKADLERKTISSRGKIEQMSRDIDNEVVKFSQAIPESPPVPHS